MSFIDKTYDPNPNFDSLRVQGNNVIKTFLHGGKREHPAGNTAIGQSMAAFVKYAPSDAIAGVRTTAQIFTRDADTWVVDALIGQYVYSYANADPDAGIWLKITDNDATTLTVSAAEGDLYAACDRVITSMWTPIQFEYTHGAGNAAFAGGVFDGENIWLVPSASADMLKINPADGSVTIYNMAAHPGTFFGGVFDGENIWLVPFGDDSLLKVDPSDGSMTPYAHGEGASAFVGGVFDGENIWLVPYNADNVVKFNPSDGSFTQYVHGQGDKAYFGGVFDGENVWLIPCDGDNLTKVDPSDGSMTHYSITAIHNGSSSFSAGIFDGESIWMTPYSSDYIVKVNPRSGTMTSYLLSGIIDLGSQGAAYDGESIWLMPYENDNVIKFNPADGSIISYPHGKGPYAFQGGVFDGERIWMIPHYSDELVAFVPPRFGRPSLHTAGPANIGGDANVKGGGIIGGVDGVECGHLDLWDGAGGNTPSYLKLCSANGTTWYLFIEADGTLKYHNAIPTADADGDAVGDQTD